MPQPPWALSSAWDASPHPSSDHLSCPSGLSFKDHPNPRTALPDPPAKSAPFHPLPTHLHMVTYEAYGCLPTCCKSHEGRGLREAQGAVPRGRQGGQGAEPPLLGPAQGCIQSPHYLPGWDWAGPLLGLTPRVRGHSRTRTQVPAPPASLGLNLLPPLPPHFLLTVP